MQFPLTTKEEDEIANNEAFRIYGDLRKKYPESSVRDFDIILNTLCFALCRQFKLHTMAEDSERCAELVKSIVLKNLKG